MDEPTSSLDEREVGGAVRRHPPAQGGGRVGALRQPQARRALRGLRPRDDHARRADGRRRAMAEITKLELVAAMLGRDLAQARRAASRSPSREPTSKPLARASRTSPPAARCATSVCRSGRGEIVGLAGLLGSGPHRDGARSVRRRPARRAATIRLDGKPVDFREPADAIRAGIGFCSEDRKVEGIVPDMSVRENLTLALLPRLSRSGIVDEAKQREIVDASSSGSASRLPRAGPADPRAVRRQPAEGAAGALAVHEPEAADPRRADARHRRRRQGRDPGADPRARRQGWAC